MDGPLSASRLDDASSATGFYFTDHMRRLCADICSRLPELDHIDLDRIAIAFCQARKRVAHGMYASLTPMRFEGGSLHTRRQGGSFTVQRLYSSNGTEMLYILSFYLPRFQDCCFHEKLVTILHELWHIGPNFDGDLRRHPGRCYVHTQSEKEYDARMREHVDRWLTLGGPDDLCGFLRYSFDELQQRFGPIYGDKISHPKLIPSSYSH